MTHRTAGHRVRRIVSLLVAGALAAALSPVAAQAAGDTTPPSTTFSAPTKNQALPAGTVAISGTSTDTASGIASAQVAIRDRVAAKWWNPTTSSWGTALKWITTTLTSPGQPSSTWSYNWSGGVAGGSYLVQARATDTSSNVAVSPFPQVTFTETAVDTTPPTTTISAPTKNQALPAGSVAIAGTSTDAVSGISSAQVAIRDRVAAKWWNPTTSSWGTALKWITTTLNSPGQPSSAWSYSWSGGVAGGSYLVQARATDTASNVAVSPFPSVSFTETTGANGPPMYVRTLAGPGLADMYPVDVTDFGNYYYVLDAGRFRIDAVNRTTGAIDFYHGGTQGKNPDQIGDARAIASDAAGNIYVADTPNNRVEEYDANLTWIKTWGTKGTGPGQLNQDYGIAIGQGIGLNGVPGEIMYITDSANRIQKFTLGGTYIGVINDVNFNAPRQIAVDPNTHNIWVVNSNTRQVIEFDENGNQLLIFGGTGSGPGQFNDDPRGVVVTPDGTKVLVTDPGNDRVQVFDTSGNHLYDLGNTDPGMLVNPRGLTVTPDGFVLVTDQWGYGLKEYTLGATSATWVRSLFGTPPPLGGVNSPRGMDVDPVTGRLFIDDYWNQRIQRFEANGTSPFSFGFRGNKGTNGSINFAWDVAIQPGTGNVFVANRESNEIKVFDQNGTQLAHWGSLGGPINLSFPQGVAFAPDGTLWVSDSNNDRIQQFSVDSGGNPTWMATYGGPTTDSSGKSCGGASNAVGCFNTPTGIDIAADGTVWVADTNNNRIEKRNPVTGVWTAFTKPVGGTVFLVPWGITVAPDGSIWVADTGHNRIVKMDASGNQVFTFLGTDVGAGAFNGPFDVAFGTGGQVYVSDTWNNRIVELGS